MSKDIYDLSPFAFGRHIGLQTKGQHIPVEALLDLAIDAYWRNRESVRGAA